MPWWTWVEWVFDVIERECEQDFMLSMVCRRNAKEPNQTMNSTRQYIDEGLLENVRWNNSAPWAPWVNLGGSAAVRCLLQGGIQSKSSYPCPRRLDRNQLLYSDFQRKMWCEFSWVGIYENWPSYGICQSARSAVYCSCRKSHLDTYIYVRIVEKVCSVDSEGYCV